jgi:KUP system potassium uptake protein
VTETVEPATTHHTAKKSALVIGSLGVVFGDIGTSPLYAIKESFHDHGAGHLVVNTENVTGLLSLVFWSLISVICVKYLAVIMRADNDGEGGILALTALIRGPRDRAKPVGVLVLLGLFGAALLYGDGMITPAISVLSAVEGTEIVTASLADWVIPIAIVILIGLFSVQRRGTAQVGRAFGPIMLVWFSSIGALGVVNILKAPGFWKPSTPSTRFGSSPITARSDFSRWVRSFSW